MIREKQLSRIYKEAKAMTGQTGENMVSLLESRLDAIVLRAGFARTILQARQEVGHRHILVDGKIVDIPSYRVKPGQTIQVKPKSQAMVPFQVAAAGAHRDVLPEVPAYLNVSLEKLTAELLRKPTRAESPVICDVQLVVEFYAR
jgi:small subunit ribosomal protein S4